MTDMITPDKAFEMFRDLVEGNEQAIPMLMYCNESGQVSILALAIEFPEGYGMQDILKVVLANARQKMGAPSWLMFSAEGWAKRATTPEESKALLEDAKPGSFQAEVNAGAKLDEVVTITAISADEGWTLVAPFARAEDGTVTWEKEEVMPPQGGIADVLHAALNNPVENTLRIGLN